MADDMITGAEFGRFRADFAAWQDRHERMTTEGFKGVHDRLDTLNGRVRTAETELALVVERAGRIDTINEAVTEIHDKGCAQYAAHRDVLEEIAPDSVKPKILTKRNAAIGGVGLGAGLLTVPVIQEIAKIVHDLLTAIGGLPK